MGKLTKIWLEEISKSTGMNNFSLSDKFSFTPVDRWLSAIDINLAYMFDIRKNYLLILLNFNLTI